MSPSLSPLTALTVLCGRNSQARQQVLERLREAVIPPSQEKVVVILCPAMVIIGYCPSAAQQQQLVSSR